MLAVAFVTSACSGGGATPSAAVVATPGSSVLPATAAAPLPTQSLAPSLAPLPGGRLAYGVFSPSGLALFTTNVDGTDTRLLLPKNAEQPRWSPDGRRLSVVSESALVGSGLVNPDGSHFMPFKNPDRTLNMGCTGWSPDGLRLACGVGTWSEADVRNGIYTVRATDGGDLIRVTNPGDAFDDPGDYSPDGRQIVFLRTITLDDELGTLMVVNVDGSNAHALTDLKVSPTNRWSPDGLTILTDLGGSLRLVPIDGRPISTIKIVANPTVTASRASWSPDGNWIVFTGIRSTSAGEDLYIVRKDGTNLHQITNTPGVDEEFGAWGVAAP
jgi:Tol biopolymer transport system component